jgi:hypothetical protein
MALALNKIYEEMLGIQSSRHEVSYCAHGPYYVADHIALLKSFQEKELKCLRLPATVPDIYAPTYAPLPASYLADPNTGDGDSYYEGESYRPENSYRNGYSSSEYRHPHLRKAATGVLALGLTAIILYRAGKNALRQSRR